METHSHSATRNFYTAFHLGVGLLKPPPKMTVPEGHGEAIIIPILSPLERSLQEAEHRARSHKKGRESRAGSERRRRSSSELEVLQLSPAMGPKEDSPVTSNLPFVYGNEVATVSPVESPADSSDGNLSSATVSPAKEKSRKKEKRASRDKQADPDTQQRSVEKTAGKIVAKTTDKSAEKREARRGSKDQPRRLNSLLDIVTDPSPAYEGRRRYSKFDVDEIVTPMHSMAPGESSTPDKGRTSSRRDKGGSGKRENRGSFERRASATPDWRRQSSLATDTSRGSADNSPDKEFKKTKTNPSIDKEFGRTRTIPGISRILQQQSISSPSSIKGVLQQHRPSSRSPAPVNRRKSNATIPKLFSPNSLAPSDASPASTSPIAPLSASPVAPLSPAFAYVARLAPHPFPLADVSSPPTLAAPLLNVRFSPKIGPMSDPPKSPVVAIELKRRVRRPSYGPSSDFSPYTVLGDPGSPASPRKSELGLLEPNSPTKAALLASAALADMQLPKKLMAPPEGLRPLARGLGSSPEQLSRRVSALRGSKPVAASLIFPCLPCLALPCLA
jgi:hypothetical protein